VPSLRNLSFTAPYMHDGRFLTLDAVMDHYSSQVQNTPNLDPLLTQGNTTGIALTVAEKINLISFLQTLNDKSFINDQRFSEQ
jgi:cytochrome c peroxidase